MFRDRQASHRVHEVAYDVMARKMDRAFLWASAAFLLVLSAFFVTVHAHGAFYRDDSLFLFIANNIYHGLAPYWASFETKNPFVEYWWAVFYVPLAPIVGIVVASRIAEGVFMAFTALFATSVVLHLGRLTRQNGGEGKGDDARLFALLVGVGVLHVLSDWRMTGNGLDISLYQSLPEGLSLLLALRLLYRRSLLGSVAFGVCVFWAWWTKQSSLMTLFFPLMLTVFWSWRIGRFKDYAANVAVAVLVFTGLVAGFFVILIFNGTWTYYLRGTYGYNSFKLGSHLPYAWARFKSMVVDSRFPFNSFAWASGVLVILAVVFGCQILLARKRRQAVPLLHVKVFALTWYAGSVFQAYAPLTFFHHYFLACWTPMAIAVAAFLLSWAPVRRNLAAVNFVVLALLCTLVLPYWSQREEIDAIRQATPIFGRVGEINAIVPKGSRVFFWGGLLHYHVLNEKKSDYAQNMVWPYIIDTVTDEERTAEIRRHLDGRPPDYVIEVFETYIAPRRLRPFRLDPDTLRKWTDHEYRVCLDLPAVPGAGETGPPIRVFQRID
ncbi:MAG TPA: hypothetical protein PK468_13065 [Candidatus Hydrogenedentes bacterium]|nr:hypothetical protein [Candidatus Hydrogenedentota bacterium]